MKHRFENKISMKFLLLFGMICLALPLFSASNWTSDLNTNLEHYWSFNQNSGLVLNDDYGTLDGTLSNMDNSSWVLGLVNNSLNFSSALLQDVREFNGSASKINLTGNFAVNFWVYPYDLSGSYIGLVYIGSATNSVSNFEIDVEAGNVFIFTEDEAWHDTGYALSINQWTMLTWIKRDTTLFLYANGTEVFNMTHTSPISNQELMFLGSHGSHFNGLIDELGMWNNSLNDSQIKDQLYNSGNGLTYLAGEEPMANATAGMSISNIIDIGNYYNSFYYVDYVNETTLIYNNIRGDFVETNIDDGDCTYNIYVNGNLLGTGDQLDLQLATQVGAGIFNVTYETTGCANYSAGSVTTTFQTYNTIYGGTMWGESPLSMSGMGWDLLLAGVWDYNHRIGSLLLSHPDPAVFNNLPDAISGNGLVAFEYLNNSNGNAGYNKVRIYNTTYGIEIAYEEDEWTISQSDPTNDIILGQIMFLTIPSNQDYDGSSLNINASQIIPLNITGCSFDLWVNGVIVDSGSSISYDYVFDAGTYDVNYSAYGCYNYFNNSLYQQFTINKATPSLSLIADSVLVNQGDNNNISASYTMPENISDCEFNLYRDGILINFTIGANSGFSENTKSFSSGHYDYVYNVTGCANYNYAQQTLGIDVLSVAYPEIRIYNPLPISYNYLINELNFSITNSIPLDSCWYSLDNGETNVTTDCSLNITGLISVQGTNTWTIWANDSLNQINTSSVTFIVDTINPEIYLVSPSDNYETYNTTLNYTYFIDDATSGIKNTTIYVYNASNFLSHREVSYSSGSKIKIFALPYGNYTWYADVWDNLGNFNSTEIRYLSIIEEPEAEIPQTIGFTEQGQIIYSVMSSAGAGLGIFMNFMSVALPPLLIILGLIGVIVVIAYFIFSSIKIKPLGVR